MRKYTYSSKENFPKDECIVQDQTESNIFNAEQIYAVLYINEDEELKRHVTFARPYICKEDNCKITYGWLDIKTNGILCNIENSCRLDGNFVVGFVKVDEKDIEKAKDEDEFYKRKVNEQWE